MVFAVERFHCTCNLARLKKYLFSRIFRTQLEFLRFRDFQIQKYTYHILKYDGNRPILMRSNFQEQSFVVSTDKYRANENPYLIISRNKLEVIRYTTFY